MLPSGAPIAAAALARNLAAMVAGGAALGLVLRRLAGPARIDRNPHVLDGLGALALVALVFPLFDGATALIAAEPGRSALVLAVAFLANLGVNLALRAGLGRALPPADAGAYALMAGNRTIAIYAAALPHEPRFALFVALYQVPILLTPLILRAFRGGSARLTARDTKPKTR